MLLASKTGSIHVLRNKFAIVRLFFNCIFIRFPVHTNLMPNRHTSFDIHMKHFTPKLSNLILYSGFPNIATIFHVGANVPAKFPRIFSH